MGVIFSGLDGSHLRDFDLSWGEVIKGKFDIFWVFVP